MEFSITTLGILGVVVLLVIATLGLVALRDFFQMSNNILRVFPLIGHFRGFMIELGPAIRQYLIANKREETPFNRSEREWIYSSGDKSNNYSGFGTDDVINGIGYPIIKNSTIPFGRLPPSISIYHERY